MAYTDNTDERINMSEHRERRIKFILGETGRDVKELNNGDGLDEYEIVAYPFLLIEQNGRGSEPPFWCSLHPTPEAAARYHDCQEYAEDWADCKLYNMDTGQEFYPEVTTIFHRFHHA